MFKLVRYFTITGVLCMIVLTLVLGFFYRQAAISNAIQEKVRENNMLAQLFANDIWEEFSPYLADIQNQTTEALLLHPGVREFDSVITCARRRS